MVVFISPRSLSAATGTVCKAAGPSHSLPMTNRYVVDYILPDFSSYMRMRIHYANDTEAHEGFCTEYEIVLVVKDSFRVVC